MKTYRSSWKQRERSLDYYHSNPHKFKKRMAEARARNIAYVNEYKKTHPCVDCGISDPDVLQFDHVNGKKRDNVSRMAGRLGGLATIIREIAKCEVRCANCHQKITRKREKAALERRKAGIVIRHEACDAIPEQLSLFGPS